MPKLIIRNGPDMGKQYSFDRSIVIGRGPLADIAFDDPTISRRHAMLSWSHNACYLSDLSSDNGTYVNNRPISEPRRLKTGDRLNVGTVVAEYIEDVDGSAGSSPPPCPADAELSFVDEARESTKVLLTMDARRAAAEAPTGMQTEAQAAALSRRLRFLEGLGNVISRTFDEQTLLSFVLDEVFDLLPHAERAFIMLQDADSPELCLKAAVTREGKTTEISASRTLLEDAMKRRKAVLIVDAAEDERYAEVESMLDIRIYSAVCVPIVFQDEIYGVLQVDSTRPAKPFSEADVALLVAVASQVGMSLANARLHARLLERELVERDMMLARNIQQRFLPQSLPRIRGYSFAVEYSPALAVGGDFYDFLHLGRERLGIVVGDVSGKGVSAALYVAKLSSDLRYLAAGETEPACILERLNEVYSHQSQQGMFFSVVLLVVETMTGKLTLASAGHPLPLVRRGNGATEALGQTGNAPIGITASATFAQYEHRLSPSDVIVAFTDGVTEAEDRDKHAFGEDRLARSVREAQGSAEGVLGGVLDSVKRFVGGGPQSDDLTVVCFGRVAP